jgi:hypothetical protein
MDRIIKQLFILAAAGMLAGCQTSAPDAEHGPDKTVAFYVKIESSVPGVGIETNKVFAGNTPLTLSIFGDAPGSFHNFGSPEYLLRAIPQNTNDFVQTKIFKTGTSSTPGDRIPGLVFFDMSQRAGGLIIDSIPDK